DGMDGLVGSLSLLYFLVYLLIALHTDYVHYVRFALIMVFCLAGFLLFNLRSPFRKKAVVFMGDAGSMMLGLSLAWFSIKLSQPSATHPLSQDMPAMTAVWILGLPLMDTVFLMFKRIRMGQSPFRADQDHLHHLLLKAGLSTQRVVVVMVFLSAILVSVGLLGWKLAMPQYWMCLFFLILFILYGYVRDNLSHIFLKERKV
ncbi:MAG: undecaprenyl/decaprenyl-phosphate alpha-N-acetylglucosaminyl 1-phosphate transferase, partial [Pseudomonadota bacterium]|nr:undecaprenyl/decaprenyl-phosphate alpha-N-acetylglucosaminyl 1-phosphate transferase [Pseudomonadota bacterium]